MSYLEHSRYRGFDGVCIACTDFYDSEVVDLIRSDIPIVTIDHMFNSRIAIISNNIKGMNDLVHHVYQKGHRKIAYIHGVDSAVTQSRLSSFYKATEELGLEVPDSYIKQAAYRDTKAAYQCTMELLELPDPPTCIFYPDDFSSFGGINAIKAKGLELPKNVSVVGYDGIRIARHIEPTLTTLRQDTEKLGKLAAEKLIGLIERPKTTVVEQIIVDGTVFEGGSVRQL